MQRAVEGELPPKGNRRVKEAQVICQQERNVRYGRRHNSQRRPLPVVTIHQERQIPDAKVISYIQAALALKKAKEQTAVEAIYINRENEALEGTTSNLFAFFKDKLVTPSQGVLKGITRRVILSLGHQHFEVEERPVKLEELFQANEVFITGTNKGVVPVIQIDDRIIGKGKPGKNTTTLIQALDQHTIEFSESVGKK